jgi:hypothetical protein
MKRLIFLVPILFLSCTSKEDLKDAKPSRCYEYRIPDEKKKEAADYVIRLMETIKITSRNDNEDWDDFINAAHDSADKIYSVRKEGYWDSYCVITN